MSTTGAQEWPQRHRERNDVTRTVIGAAREVHRELGPGLLEFVSEECLCLELNERAMSYERQRRVPVSYKGRIIDAHYRIDLIVEATVVVEIRAVEAIRPVHVAQLLSYLVLARCPPGLIVSFNEARLIDGVRRVAGRNLGLPPRGLARGASKSRSRGGKQPS